MPNCFSLFSSNNRALTNEKELLMFFIGTEKIQEQNVDPELLNALFERTNNDSTGHTFKTRKESVL